MIPQSKPWPADFPNIAWHVTVQAMHSHLDYAAAKAGDKLAAARLVRDLVDPDKVAWLAKSYPDCTLVPVHAEEATGRNAIPVAFAKLLADLGEVQLFTGIVQANTRGATGQDALYRFAFRARFDGQVPADRRCVLIDDLRSMGGTLSDMRNHVEASGARVVAMMTLAYDPRRAPGGEVRIASTNDRWQALDSKFGLANLSTVLHELNIYTDARALTAGEARYLLDVWSSVDAFRAAIIARRRSRERED